MCLGALFLFCFVISVTAPPMASAVAHEIARDIFDFGSVVLITLALIRVVFGKVAQ